MNIFLNIPKDLLEHLDKSYPDQHPKLSTPEREVWFKAGQRSVVNALLDMDRAQEEGQIEGSQHNVFSQLGSGGSADRDTRPASATGARTAASPGNRLRG